MSNNVYPLWKNALMSEVATNKSLDQTGANAPAVALVTTGSGGYTYSDLHQFFTDVTGVQNVTKPLTAVTLTSNVFSADGVVFTGVTGTTIGAFVIFRQNAGANTTWRLVLYEDSSVIGLPMVPNGGNLLVTWSTQGIFAL